MSDDTMNPLQKSWQQEASENGWKSPEEIEQMTVSLMPICDKSCSDAEQAVQDERRRIGEWLETTQNWSVTAAATGESWVKVWESDVDKLKAGKPVEVE